MLKTDVKGGVALRLANRVFCSREFFSLPVPHRVKGKLWNADNHPPLQDVQNMELCLRSVEYSINLHFDLVLSCVQMSIILKGCTQ